MGKAGKQERKEIHPERREAREFTDACGELCRAAALDDRPKPRSDPIPLRNCMKVQTCLRTPPKAIALGCGVFAVCWRFIVGTLVNMLLPIKLTLQFFSIVGNPIR